jgi:hypothetical protein
VLNQARSGIHEFVAVYLTRERAQWFIDARRRPGLLEIREVRIDEDPER